MLAEIAAWVGDHSLQLLVAAYAWVMFANAVKVQQKIEKIEYQLGNTNMYLCSKQMNEEYDAYADYESARQIVDWGHTWNWDDTDAASTDERIMDLLKSFKHLRAVPRSSGERR